MWLHDDVVEDNCREPCVALSKHFSIRKHFPKPYSSRVAPFYKLTRVGNIPPKVFIKPFCFDKTTFFSKTGSHLRSSFSVSNGGAINEHDASHHTLREMVMGSTGFLHTGVIIGVGQLGDAKPSIDKHFVKICT